MYVILKIHVFQYLSDSTTIKLLQKDYRQPSSWRREQEKLFWRRESSITGKKAMGRLRSIRVSAFTGDFLFANKESVLYIFGLRLY